MTHFRRATEAASGVKNKEEQEKKENPMKKTLLPIAIAFTLIALAPAAFAGSNTNPLNLSATVINNCTISTTPVGFGNYDPLSGAVNNAFGTVVIACTKGAGPSLTLGNGNNGVRQMKDAGAQLMTYELYKPPSNVAGAACTWVTPTRWGTAVGETFTPTAAPDKTARTYNVCGQVAAGLDLAAGSFTDQVVATINF